MQVQVSINKMNSGRLQVFVKRIGPSVSTGPVVTYREEADARKVLATFGFSQEIIDGRLEMLLTDFGPNESLPFPEADIPVGVLHSHGFLAI
ncbi:MAG TPA: hypothetical protein VFQ41_08835 [Candidatus Angelobacter sp.]|nr:hypothetical protein [Candidatus Angelobacter sp.]